MKKVKQNRKRGDIRPEYDFGSMKGGIRGKYAAEYRKGTNVVLLESDVARVFRDSAAVNKALRVYLSEHGEPSTREAD
jgi:hypothetical protein